MKTALFRSAASDNGGFFANHSKPRNHTENSYWFARKNIDAFSSDISLFIMSFKLTWHHIYRRYIFDIESISMHPLLWMNAILDFICKGFAEHWWTGSKWNSELKYMYRTGIVSATPRLPTWRVIQTNRPRWKFMSEFWKWYCASTGFRNFVFVV